MTDIGGASFAMGPVRPPSIKLDPVAVYSGQDGGRLIRIPGEPILEARLVLSSGGSEGGGMALKAILHMRIEIHHMAEAASVGVIEET